MKQKILVIEDEQDIQTLLEYNLQQAGYEAVLCENGEDGLWLAIEHKPDLILLDRMVGQMIMLPNLSARQSWSRGSEPYCAEMHADMMPS